MATKAPYLSTEIHIAIGKLSVAAARLEYHLERTIDVLLLHEKNLAKFVLTNLGQDRIVSLFAALLLDALPFYQDVKANELVSEIERLRTERNKILHWLWHQDQKSDVAHHMKVRPHRKHEIDKKTAPEIEQIAGQFDAVAKKLIEWGDFLRPLLQPPLQPTPSPLSLPRGLKEPSPKGLLGT